MVRFFFKFNKKCKTASVYSSKIRPRRNGRTTSVNSVLGNIQKESGCHPDGDVAIIVHSWSENCTTPWVHELVKSKKMSV